MKLGDLVMVHNNPLKAGIILREDGCLDRVNNKWIRTAIYYVDQVGWCQPKDMKKRKHLRKIEIICPRCGWATWFRVATRSDNVEYIVSKYINSQHVCCSRSAFDGVITERKVVV